MQTKRSVARCALGLLALCLPVLLWAAAPSYRIDSVHTRVVFSVEHNGFSRALGTLSGLRGSLTFAADDWSSATVDVFIPLQRLDLGDADWNTRMLKDDFLALSVQKEARFQSTRVEPIDDTHATIYGNLSVRGESIEVALTAKLNRAARNPLTLRRTVGFSATATLSRSALGMRSWKSMIGDSVDLVIELEATRGKASKKRDDEAADVSQHQQPHDLKH